VARGARRRGAGSQGLAPRRVGECRRGLAVGHPRARVRARSPGRGALSGLAGCLAASPHRSGFGRGDGAPAASGLRLRGAEAGRAVHPVGGGAGAGGARGGRRSVGGRARSPRPRRREGERGPGRAARCVPRGFTPARARPLAGAGCARPAAGSSRGRVPEAHPLRRSGHDFFWKCRSRRNLRGTGTRPRGAQPARPAPPTLSRGCRQDRSCAGGERPHTARGCDSSTIGLEAVGLEGRFEGVWHSHVKRT